MKVKKKKRNTAIKPSQIQRIFFTILLILILIIFCVSPIIGDYLQGQYLIRGKPEVIFFIYRSVPLISFSCAFIGGMISFGYCNNYRDTKFTLFKNWRGLGIFIISIITFLTIPFAFVNKRFDISAKGIYEYSAFDKVKEKYLWTDVKEAKAYICFEPYGTGGGRNEFNYIIILKNDKALDLVEDGHSRNWWDSLYQIDSILKEENIPVYRDKSNLDTLDSEYEDKVRRLIY